jgi:methionyl-tRNA formyltransferase
MNMAVLTNWGLGLELLRTLDQLAQVRIAFVVTQRLENSTDRWANVVYDFSRARAYPTLNQKEATFSLITHEIKRLQVDLLVAHAYMKILPKTVFTAPRLGSINIHASLLPKHRGASPTVSVLRNRETQTGLTCHCIDEGIDTGAIIHQVAIPVFPGDTVGSIIERQKRVVKELVVESLKRISDRHFVPTAQHDQPNYGTTHSITRNGMP